MQTALTVASNFTPPGVGTLIGLANLGISAARGQEISAIDVALSLVPGGAVGKIAGVGAKILKRGADTVKAVTRTANALHEVYEGGMELYSARGSLRDSYEAFKKGDYLGAAMSLGEAGMSIAGAKQGLKSAKGLTMGRYSHCQQQRVYDWHSNQDSCFVAGTPLKTPEGSKPIEAFVMGDRILTRNEHDANAPLSVGVVMQTFIRVSRIQNVLVEGRILETTPEHPFWVDGKGWIPAGELQEGDRLQTSLGYWLTCGGSVDSGKVLTVYNLEVAGDHTYFVGEQSWGFDVWVHNVSSKYTTHSQPFAARTDNDGRTIRAEGILSGPHPNRKKGGRPEPIGGRSPGHHRGHLVPENHVDNPDLVNVRTNIISEASRSNLSSKKKFENMAGGVAAANPDKVVRTTHFPKYKDGDTTPHAVTHYLSVDGVVVYGITIFNR